MIRRPGGHNAGGNANQGVSISAVAKGDLKRMSYQFRHVVHCSCPLVWTDITLVSVRKLASQAEKEHSHKDPISLPSIDPKNWPNNIEATNELFWGLRGLD